MNQSIDAQDTGHIQQAALLGAVADPLRLAILAAIRQPRPVLEICDALGGLAQPRVSHHLAVLREQGLVSVERRGRQRLYGWANPGPGPCRDVLQLLSAWMRRPPGPGRVRAAQLAGPGESARGPVRGPELEDFLL